MHAHFSCRTFTSRARRLALVLAVGAVALTSASSAHAASVAMSGGVLIFEADPGEQNTVEINRTSAGFARVWGGSSVDLRILTPGTCAPSPPSDVVCDLPQRVVVKTGDENDNARSIDFPAEVQLGPGDDELLSGRFADTVIGGDGRDSVSYFEFAQGGPRRTSGVTVTYDGQANDGANGEGDNVDASVEVVSATGMDDRLIGDAGAQELQGGGGNDVLEGAAGNDTLSGSAGDDVLNGGAGDDSIDGDADRDRIDAGPGRDHVRGDQPCRVFTCGGGPDEITVRDGEPDTVQCGIGHDRVIADAIDGVQRDGFEVCEQVELPIATLPAQPTPAATRPAPSARAGMVRVASGGRLPRILRRGIRLTVSCPQACTVAGTASVSARDAKRLGLKRARIAGGTTTIPAAGRSRTLTLRIDPRTRRSLRRARRLSAMVNVTFQYANGSTSTSRKATFRS